jgi:peptidyl-prolyl cis-trans isomerase A (cyclophilin A)
MNARSAILHATLALSLAACAAPRDPALERAVIENRLKQTKPAPADGDSAPPAAPESASATVTEVPIKTYSDGEIARIMAQVGGAGAKLLMSLETGLGPIRCTLEPDLAPQTVANLVGLANGLTPWRSDPKTEATARRLYDGLTFHRAINDFIIQTGNPTGRYNAGPGWRITRETGGTSLFAEPGALAMIDDGDASHGSQFFIAVRADKALANRYAAFGRCADLDLVRRIANAEKRTASDGKPSVPVSPVTLDKLVITRGD